VLSFKEVFVKISAYCTKDYQEKVNAIHICLADAPLKRGAIFMNVYLCSLR